MSAENTLMKTLTKINRMDIVHLIETKIIQSSQEQLSHTYAEIEQTISLDHSEGMDDNDLKLIRLLCFLESHIILFFTFPADDESLHFYNDFTTFQQKLCWPCRFFSPTGGHGQPQARSASRSHAKRIRTWAFGGICRGSLLQCIFP